MEAAGVGGPASGRGRPGGSARLRCSFWITRPSPQSGACTGRRLGRLAAGWRPASLATVAAARRRGLGERVDHLERPWHPHASASSRVLRRRGPGRSRGSGDARSRRRVAELGQDPAELCDRPKRGRGATSARRLGRPRPANTEVTRSPCPREARPAASPRRLRSASSSQWPARSGAAVSKDGGSVALAPASANALTSTLCPERCGASTSASTSTSM